MNDCLYYLLFYICVENRDENKNNDENKAFNSKKKFYGKFFFLDNKI